ncbi:MAG: sugar transferase [Chloroflexi bacterium HGW-Chloroflexi-8]|nr:MAG: sugar transferase [Chloroflexi bacterium HGW-Chloroflexi-8]
MDSIINPEKEYTNSKKKSINAGIQNTPKLIQVVFLYLGLLISDFLMIGFAFRFAYWIRFEINLPFFVRDALASPDYYENLIVIIIPVWLLVFILSGLYTMDNLMGGVKEYNLLFYSNTIAVLVMVATGFFQPNIIFARGWLLISWISAFFFTALGRFTLRRIFYFMRTKDWYLQNTVVVGFNEEATSMVEQFLNPKQSGLRILGFVDCKETPGTQIYRHLKCLGNISNLEPIISEYNIQKIILISSALSHEQVLDIYQNYGMSEKIKLHISSGLYEIVTTGMKVREYAWVPLVEVNKVRLTGMNYWLKIILDYGITIPGIIFLSPFLFIVGLLIKLDSPGPIFHRRRVMGVNGKEFDAFKFRTMFVNGDEILQKYPDKVEELSKTHKLKDDPRITKIGAFLRKWSIDEFPQLFNILRNEMSLVGPRMISPEEVQDYQKWGMNLLTVKPGITGKWQVSGRSDISYQQRVQLDMYYIRNWSIWLDVQLLIQTIPAVISKKGAY